MRYGSRFNHGDFLLHNARRRRRVRRRNGDILRLSRIVNRRRLRHHRIGIDRRVGIFSGGRERLRQCRDDALKDGVNLADSGDFRDFPLLPVVRDERQRLILVNAQAINDGGFDIIIPLHQGLTRLIVHIRRSRRVVLKVIRAARRQMNASPGQAFNDQIKGHLNR